MNDVQVNAAELHNHAAELDHTADRLAIAARAGEAVISDSGAYGQLCTFVPQFLNLLRQSMVDGMDTAAQSVRNTATDISAVADAYTDSDQRAADLLEKPR